MKSSVFVFICFLVVGCVSNTTNVEKAEGPRITDIVIDQSLPAPEKTVSGRKFSFYEKKSAGPLSEPSLQKIKEVVRKHMKGLGYEEAPSARKAHVSIHLYSDRYSVSEEIPGSKLSEFSSHSLRKDTAGNVIFDQTSNSAVVARFNITLFINQFERRPVTYSYLTFTSPNPDWTGYEDYLVALTDREFPQLISKAPAADQKMKGDPGCIPRFGYEHVNGTITEVPKGSAADEAGLKVGDVVESVDSQSLSDSLENAEIYEKRIKVPVKVKRGKETIRAMMRAKVVCS
jgi:hypothetical protein